MPFTKFTNLNFAEIKESVKDYLRANSDFKDFDFEGSNMSIIVDILAYNSYIVIWLLMSPSWIQQHYEKMLFL